MKKRKMTPEEKARMRAHLRQSRENGRLLWQYLDKAWDELEERAAREGRSLSHPKPARPVWADPPSS